MILLQDEWMNKLIGSCVQWNSNVSLNSTFFVMNDLTTSNQCNTPIYNNSAFICFVVCFFSDVVQKHFRHLISTFIFSCFKYVAVLQLSVSAACRSVVVVDELSQITRFQGTQLPSQCASHSYSNHSQVRGGRRVHQKSSSPHIWTSYVSKVSAE